MLHRIVDQHLRHRERDAQEFRDLPQPGAAELVHFEGDPAALGQARQRPLELAQFVPEERLGLRRRGRVGDTLAAASGSMLAKILSSRAVLRRRSRARLRTMR